MSTKSKFERQLGFRQIGFSVKIPDIGRSLKPFDYIVGLPVNIKGSKILRFVAIEAKSARGWTLHGSSILPHQVKALDLVESLAPYSSWLAIGFLDMPKMQRDWNRGKISKSLRPEAYLLWWEDAKLIRQGEHGTIRYKDIIKHYPKSKMDYVKVRTAYKWIPGRGSTFYKVLTG